MDLEACAFELDEQPTSLGMVIASAQIAGLLTEHRRSIQAGFVAQARESVRGSKPTSEMIQARLDHWRNARDLSSVEETKQWLKKHEVALDDLVKYLGRQLRIEAEPESIADLAGAFRAEHGDVVQLLPLEVLFSGKLPDLVHQVSLLSAAEPTADPSRAAALKKALLRGLESASNNFAALEQRLALTRSQLEQVIEREVSHQLFQRQVATPEALRDLLQHRKRDLTRLEYVSAVFADKDTAQETICCLAESKWLEPLGEANDFATQRHRTFIEDLDGSVLSSRLAASRGGDCFGPTPAKGRWLVYEVLERTEPSLEDAEVRRRIESVVIKRALGPSAERRVRIRYGI